MRLKAAALTAAAVLLVGACGDDARGDAGPPEPPRTAEASRTADLSAPPTARQTPQPPCRDASPEVRGDAALRSLPSSWRASGATVTFAPGQPGMLGETTINKPLRVIVYVRPCAEENDDLLRHVIAHELGHAWDRYRMTDALRAEYLRMRRIDPSTPWLGCAGCEDFATPAGDFAETYAQWLRGSAESRSELAPPATPEQLEAIAARFFR